MIPHPDQHFGNHFYSQNGEDIVVLNIFEQWDDHDISYLDIGAHHPHIISNTALLYDRGNRGINIECNPNLFNEFIRYRPEDINLNIAIAPESGKRTFYMFDAWSGRNTLCSSEAEDVTYKYGLQLKDDIEVECRNINDVIREVNGGKWPKFLSIDIEGMDYEILQGCDFRHSRPLVVCAECRIHDEGIWFQMMKEHEFDPYCRMGENVIFVQEDVSKTLKKGWK